MFLLACGTVLIAVLLWYWQKGSRMREMIGKFPGPTNYPLLGNALELGVTTSDFMTNICRMSTQYRGGPFRIWVGPSTAYIILTEPKDMEIILGSNKLIDKGDLYEYLYPWLGTGLLTSSGIKWRRHRKIITPTFHFKILEEFIDVFNANGEILVEKLRKEVGGGGFDVYNYVTLYALDVICETAMGVKINAQHDSESEYIKAIRDQSEIVIKRSIKPWLGMEWIFNLTKYRSMNAKSLDTLHTITKDVIRKRRSEISAEKAAAGNSASAVDQGDGVKRRLAFLDMLIESTYEGSLLTDENIREEVDTFMFEGHDTTSSGISFTLWLLSWHQDVQEKVVKEILEVYPDPKEPLSFRGLQELKYLERVIKESLRLYPSVPMFGRHLSEDVQLSGGQIAPKGATVVICAGLMQRNPRVFQDPLKFDPDRFLQDNANGRNPYAYVPFSAGPRNCIGQKFALLELKSAVVHVLRNFRLYPGTQQPDLVLANELILISKTGIKIKITSRK